MMSEQNIQHTCKSHEINKKIISTLATIHCSRSGYYLIICTRRFKLLQDLAEDTGITLQNLQEALKFVDIDAFEETVVF